MSSQFLSALLMALPLARGSGTAATTVNVDGPLISRPYVDITTNLMRRFGVAVDARRTPRFRRARRRALCESRARCVVEGDASSASYFLAAGAIGGGPVRVTGVGRESIQGDVAFADVLGAPGRRHPLRTRTGSRRARGARLRGGTIDCVAIPDAAMTLAMTALFADAPTTLTNIGSWRVKETDRIAAMATELAQARRDRGRAATTGCASRRRQRQTPASRATIDTYDDHRMAMCFSLATLAGVPVTINDPGCVRKTFPGYFDAFARHCPMSRLTPDCPR